MDGFGITPDDWPQTWPPGVTIPRTALLVPWKTAVQGRAVVATGTYEVFREVFPEEEYFLRELWKHRLGEQAHLEALLNRVGFIFQGSRDDVSERLGLYAWASLSISDRLEDLTTQREEIARSVGADTRFELLDEITLALTWLRDLSRLWIHYSYTGEMHSDDLPWEAEALGIRKPRSESEARWAFETGLSAAMTEFSPHLQRYATAPASVKVKDFDTQRRSAADFAATGSKLPSFYALIARQLYNHVVERPTYQECASETCNQIFAHQVRNGVAKYAPHAEGVKYCSRRCAKAQAQREWRRRKKESGS